MFSTGLLISAAGTIVLALVDKTLDESGYQILGTVLRIAIPLSAMLLGVYFLEHNSLLRWLR